MPDSRQSAGSPKRHQIALAKSATQFCYLPVNESLREWELYLTSVGQSIYKPCQKYPQAGHPETHNFTWASGRILSEYAVVLITAGSGEYEFRNFAPGRCRRGDALLISPGQWHRYRPLPDTGWSELWICLGGEYPHRLREKGLAFAKPCISLETHFTAVNQAMLNLVRKVRQQTNFNSTFFSSKVLEIIALITDASGLPRAQLGGKYRIREPQVAKAIEFIWSNSHRPLSIDEVAQAAGLLARTLERRFAACHERGIREEIEWSRYSRARRILKETTLPIKEIAYSCGFGDPRRMIEAFRRLTAETPTAIRNDTSEKNIN
jgi:AraC-like DNA-binding protein